VSDARWIRCNDVEPKVFPANRVTRVLAGEGGLPSEGFVMGYVVVEPGGQVPTHNHPQEEVYFVLEGRGQVVVDETTFEMEPLSAVYIPSGEPHHLINTGEEVLRFVFTYAPGGVVDHWAEEMATAEEEA
jgi:mannose-6-phosphate isomerase-like protein (cupin superfamily)